jgi:hypothetical protein
MDTQGIKTGVTQTKGWEAVTYRTTEELREGDMGEWGGDSKAQKNSSTKLVKVR